VIASQASVNQAQSNVNQAEVAANQVNLNQKQVVAPIDGIVAIFHQSGRLRECRATPGLDYQKMTLDMRLSVPSNNLASCVRVACRATRC